RAAQAVLAPRARRRAAQGARPARGRERLDPARPGCRHPGACVASGRRFRSPPVQYFTLAPALSLRKGWHGGWSSLPQETKRSRGGLLKLLDLAPWRLGPNWTAQGAGAPHGMRLSSHFQAIFGAAERRPVGYEALIRATRDDGLAVEPA